MVLSTFKKKTGFIVNKPIVMVPKISKSQKKKIELMNGISVKVTDNKKTGKVIMKVAK